MSDAATAYHRVSSEDRQRIVDAFRDGVDYVTCAAQLGLWDGMGWGVILFSLGRCVRYAECDT